MNREQPGLDPRRLANLMRDAVERCRLDLGGRVVLTEAASGAYVITPVLAALAGAERVYALTRSTRFGTVAEIAAQTHRLAELADVAGKIEIVTEKAPAVVAAADIITNSGHVRPIDAHMIDLMKPGAVVSLMFETWEYRDGDLDLEACRRRGVVVAGVNERHPAVDVFSFLGIMAVKQLLDAGVAVYSSQILLLCDNPFSSFIVRGLESAGASVTVRTRLPGRLEAYDAIVVALQPRSEYVLGAPEARALARNAPGAVLVQYWGDIDRPALLEAGVPVWPADAPRAGHMGILPSGVGPEPIVRLQAGGLKVGELLSRGVEQACAADLEFVQLF